MCAGAESREAPNKQPMFQNWQGSSRSMQRGIIVEGFRCSVDMNGAKYTRLITDGDSSTHREILEAAPHDTQYVEKVQCANHLHRNYFII